MPGVCPKGSGDRSWPRSGSAFSLCGDPCFILRHSSHFLVQRRHFSNPQTEWVLGARRRALRSTRCLTASFSARPAHEACPVPSSRRKEWPRPEGRVGIPPDPKAGWGPPLPLPQHIACKIEKTQSLESSLLRVMRPLCFVQLTHMFLYRLNLRIFCFIPGTLLICSEVEPAFQGA